MEFYCPAIGQHNNTVIWNLLCLCWIVDVHVHVDSLFELAEFVLDLHIRAHYSDNYQLHFRMNRTWTQRDYTLRRRPLNSVAMNLE